MMTALRWMLPPLLLAGGWGCVNVKVEPVEVKPIHITMDINLKIDRSLDEFFAYQQPAGGGAVVLPPATTMPSNAGGK